VLSDAFFRFLQDFETGDTHSQYLKNPYRAGHRRIGRAGVFHLPRLELSGRNSIRQVAIAAMIRWCATSLADSHFSTLSVSFSRRWTTRQHTAANERPLLFDSSKRKRMGLQKSGLFAIAARVLSLSKLHVLVGTGAIKVRRGEIGLRRLCNRSDRRVHRLIHPHPIP